MADLGLFKFARKEGEILIYFDHMLDVMTI